jgi:hypothetical protein
MRMFVDKGDFNLDYMDIREVSLAGLPHLSNTEDIAISIYPNPCKMGASLSVVVNGVNAPDGVLDIYDLVGNKLSTEKISFSDSQKTNADINAITKSGIYLMRFSVNNKIYWKKLSIL